MNTLIAAVTFIHGDPAWDVRLMVGEKLKLEVGVSSTLDALLTSSSGVHQDRARSAAARAYRAHLLRTSSLLLAKWSRDGAARGADPWEFAVEQARGFAKSALLRVIMSDGFAGLQSLEHASAPIPTTVEDELLGPPLLDDPWDPALLSVLGEPPDAVPAPPRGEPTARVDCGSAKRPNPALAVCLPDGPQPTAAQLKAAVKFVFGTVDWTIRQEPGSRFQLRVSAPGSRARGYFRGERLTSMPERCRSFIARQLIRVVNSTTSSRFAEEAHFAGAETRREQLTAYRVRLQVEFERAAKGGVSALTTSPWEPYAAQPAREA